MKSYTDLDQSRKLAKLLPLESADMCYHYGGLSDCDDAEADILLKCELGQHFIIFPNDVPCWSLAALLGVLKERNDCNTLEMFTNKAQLYTITTSYYKDASWKDMSTVSDNPVDACYEMIIKLKEKNLI